MDTSNLKLETENLFLKAISLDYKDNIFREFTPEITTYMLSKSPDHISETVEFIKTGMEKNKEGQDFYAVVLNKENGEFLGGTGIHNIDSKTPMLGIWIKKSAQGKGYGKEAIRELKKWADKNLAYDYILYQADKSNAASKRIPESLGGIMSDEYDKENKSGRILHLVEYRIYPKNEES